MLTGGSRENPDIDLASEGAPVVLEVMFCEG